jgi:hypothetical protein
MIGPPQSGLLKKNLSITILFANFRSVLGHRSLVIIAKLSSGRPWRDTGNVLGNKGGGAAVITVLAVEAEDRAALRPLHSFRETGAPPESPSR